jgi:hypothetical protein
MQDAQVPGDPEDGASEPPRRANLRLRDAEAVASVRRDMFGDGSLLDTLAASPLAPQDSENPRSASVQAVDPSRPEGAGGEVTRDAAHPTELAATASPAVPQPLANVAQSLDAIIDSFAAQPVAGGPQRPGEDKVEASLAALPATFRTPGTEADSAESSPGAGSGTTTPPMGISSLFDSLDSFGQRGRGAWSAEEPPAPTAPGVDLDMSMLEAGQPAHPALEPESGPPIGAALEGASTQPVQPGSQVQEIRAEDVLGSVEEPPAPSAPTLDLDMSMLERPHARPVLQPEGDPSPFSEHGVQADGIRAGEVEEYEQNAMEPPLVRAADASGEPDAPAEDSGKPPYADDARFSPFFGRVWAPAFAERPDAPGGQSYPELSDLADRAQAASPQPFIEPLVMPAYPEPAEPAAPPMFDAASKIEAEAQAAADALDNLKRLLASRTPGPEQPIESPGDSPAAGYAGFNLQGDPSPFPSGGPAALMPMPMPAPPERGRMRGIYALGFLTGLGLAVMAGVALYLLINMV